MSGNLYDANFMNNFSKQQNSHVQAYNKNKISQGFQGMDVFGIGTAIAGVANAIGSGVINSKNFNEQKRQYEQNMKWQREQFESLKQREDTAVRRRMTDLKAAGLNPLMADGSNGAQASSTSYSGSEAPQQQYNSDILPTMLSAMLDSRRVKNEIAQTKLEKERLHNQILDSQQNRLESLSRQLLNAKTLAEKDALIKQIQATEKLINKQAESLGININIARLYGEPTGISPNPVSKSGIAKMVLNPNNPTDSNEKKTINKIDTSDSKDMQLLKDMIGKEKLRGRDIEFVIKKYGDKIPGKDLKEKADWIIKNIWSHI